MTKTDNRRRAPRMRYRVTVHYSEESEAETTTSEGQMLDISSGGLAFRCNADENCPYEGQQLKIRFSIPNPKGDDTSMMDFDRTGRVLGYSRSIRPCGMSPFDLTSPCPWERSFLIPLDCISQIRNPGL